MPPNYATVLAKIAVEFGEAVYDARLRAFRKAKMALREIPQNQLPSLKKTINGVLNAVICHEIDYRLHGEDWDPEVQVATDVNPSDEGEFVE